jgi:hypothetical protein
MTKEKEPELTLEQKLKFMAQLQCTIEEAAGQLDMSPATFRKTLSENMHLKEIWERGPAKGRVSLRRQQFQQASGFSPQAVAMAIHLGKHWLGQIDKQNIEVSGNINLSANRTASDIMLDNIKPELLLKEEQVELAELCDLVDEHRLESLSTAQRVRFFSLINKGTPVSAEEEARRDEKVVMLALPMPKAA